MGKITKINYESYGRTNAKTLDIIITKDICEDFANLDVDNFIFEIYKKTNSTTSTGTVTITKEYQVANLFVEKIGDTFKPVAPYYATLTIKSNKNIWSSKAANNSFAIYIVDEIDKCIEGKDNKLKKVELPDAVIL